MLGFRRCGGRARVNKFSREEEYDRQAQKSRRETPSSATAVVVLSKALFGRIHRRGAVRAATFYASLSSVERRDRVELRRCAEQALKNLEQAVQESGATVALGPLPAALGSESHLVELFQNLFSNAIKYRSAAPVEIHVTAERLGQEWVVKVKDNGLGIDPEYHDQIFGLFKRLHGQSIPGTGLGLAICKKIVERMGGKIWVESELGKGCVFCFTVPDAAHALSGKNASATSS